MPEPKESNARKMSPIIPKDPNAVAEFIRDAANYISYIENKWLTKFVYEKDELKTKISAIENALRIRRDDYVGNNMEEIPKDFRKSATAINQYVDYNIFTDETKEANIEIVKMKRELASIRGKITAWQTVKEQYERAIQSATMILAWEKAHMKLGGS